MGNVLTLTGTLGGVIITQAANSMLVVVDAGEGFGAGAISKRKPTHNVHLPQLHRGAAFQRFHLRERRSRRLGSIMPARTNARYAADSEGSGLTRRLASSNTSRRGPQYGRERRNSSNSASTSAGI
jgi:hypothetical protein